MKRSVGENKSCPQIAWQGRLVCDVHFVKRQAGKAEHRYGMWSVFGRSGSRWYLKVWMAGKAWYVSRPLGGAYGFASDGCSGLVLPKNSLEHRPA